jgi:hypothetical protein
MARVWFDEYVACVWRFVSSMLGLDGAVRKVWMGVEKGSAGVPWLEPLNRMFFDGSSVLAGIDGLGVQWLDSLHRIFESMMVKIVVTSKNMGIE